MNEKQEDKLTKLGIPHSFTIANMPHRVILEHTAVDEHENQVFGLYSSVDATITLSEFIERGNKDRKDIPVPDEQIKNTFYHELFHAFNFYWNNEFREDLAQSFSNFLREFETTKK